MSEFNDFCYTQLNSLICQIIRLSKNNKKRNVLEKNVEFTEKYYEISSATIAIFTKNSQVCSLFNRIKLFYSISLKFSKDGAKGRKDYSPVMWDAYFLEKKDIEIDRGTFRVYFSKPPIQNGPILLLLHGGGFSALTWSLFTVSWLLWGSLKKKNCFH